MTRHRFRPLRLLLAGAMFLPALALVASPASAATVTKPIPLELSAHRHTSLFDTGVLLCDECAPDLMFPAPETALGFQIDASADVDYVAPMIDTVSYTDSLLRQGTDTDAVDTLTMLPTGSVNIGVDLHSFFGFYTRADNAQNWHEAPILPDFLAPDPFPTHKDFTFPCQLPAPGQAPVTCVANGSLLSVPLLGVPILPGLVSIDFDFQLSLSVTLSSDGVAVVRHLEVVGGPGGGAPDANLAFTSASKADSFNVGCDQPAGNDVRYDISDPSYHLHPSIGLTASLDLLLDIIAIPNINLATFWSATLPLADLADETLTGPGGSTVLGPLQKDNTVPTADAGLSDYPGTEGSSITFNGLGTKDNCGTPTMRWEFSDGGVAFGPLPKHTFADDGDYTGLLTATDQAGNTSTDTFKITVANAAPKANAGPDTTADWGRPVQFNGSAVDPGTADQATLGYSWAFGDGASAGGASAVHSYATPGVKTSTLTVTDDTPGVSDADSRDVTVTKRSVTIANTGAQSGTYGTAGTVAATVTDEYGQAVAGRTVEFRMDGTLVGAGSTGSTGRATFSLVPGVVAGGHTLTATFTGDSLYEGGDVNGTFTVANKATVISYTGALTGAANKVIALGATLVDATGTPLAGRTVTFTLGTQTATAVTDATGKAATSLKLTQKNGTYTVQAAFAAGGTDSAKYLASSDAKTFKLQAK